MKKLLLVLAIISVFGTSVYAEDIMENVSKEIVPINIELDREENAFISQGELINEIDKISEKSEVDILLNESVVEYDVSPMYINGKLMIPLRHTLESMDYTVTWNQDEDSVEIYKKAQHTKLYIGRNSYIRNKMTPFELSEAPIIVKGRTLVPIEFIHEILSIGLKIEGNSITLIEQLNSEEISLLSTHSGFLVKVERRDGVIKYHLSSEKDGEISLIVSMNDTDSYYQTIPKIGSNVNIIGSSIMLMSYPGQTGGYILY